MKNFSFIADDNGELIDVTEKDNISEMSGLTETKVMLNIQLKVDVNKDHIYFYVTNVVDEEIQKAYKKIQKRLK